jgi:hypothetical protein
VDQNKGGVRGHAAVGLTRAACAYLSLR